MSVPTTSFADIVAAVRDAAGIYDSLEYMTDTEAEAYIREANSHCQSALPSIWNFVVVKDQDAYYVRPALDITGSYFHALVHTAIWRAMLGQAVSRAGQNPGDFVADGKSQNPSTAVAQLRAAAREKYQDVRAIYNGLLGFRNPNAFQMTG